MAILSVIIAPDPRLKAKSAPVERVDDGIRRLMDGLLETMYDAPGIGLAAPQVGVQKRVIVVDIAKRDEEPQPHMLANPEIVWRADETMLSEEGCLSLPEYFGEVSRSRAARLRYLDHENEIRELAAEELLATCLQHEIDHLDGILFVDHMSLVRRRIILRKLAKAKRAEATATA